MWVKYPEFPSYVINIFVHICALLNLCPAVHIKGSWILCKLCFLSGNNFERHSLFTQPCLTGFTCFKYWALSFTGKSYTSTMLESTHLCENTMSLLNSNLHSLSESTFNHQCSATIFKCTLLWVAIQEYSEKSHVVDGPSVRYLGHIKLSLLSATLFLAVKTKPFYPSWQCTVVLYHSLFNIVIDKFINCIMFLSTTTAFNFS